MDNLDFSEEEIQEQLAILGYKNISKHRLREFKQDLDELIRRGEWKSFTSPTQVDSTKPQTVAPQPSPPAYTKEKVSQCCFEDSVEGFFLHSGQADHDRKVLTTCQNRDFGRQQGRCDTYAQHSVAPTLRLPPGAPSRLQVEPDPDDSLRPPLADSYTSSPDTHGRRLIKRKVLRKHQGQSLVCEESVYIEDSGVPVATMYRNSRWDGDSDDADKNSLNSSFWSDRERSDGEEEKVEIVREESKSAALQEASEEKTEPNEGDEEGESPEGGSEDEADDEDDEEEDSETEQVINDENSKPAGDAEESFQEASEEEQPELKEGIRSGESSEGGSDDDEDDEEEDSETEQMNEEGESKPVGEAEESVQEASEEEEPELKEGNLSGESSEGGSDEEYDDEEEDLETERGIGEEESKSVGDEEESFQEASEEEEPEPNEGNTSGESLESGSDDEEDVDNESYDDEEEEEDLETERVIGEEDTKPVNDTQEPLREASEEEKHELNVGHMSGKNMEGGSDEDDDEEGEESHSSSCDSPAPSLMTSGYGTYRPEEQEGGDHTIAEFDQDSRGDLSEMRDDEEDGRSLCSFGGFDVEPKQPNHEDTRPLSALAAPEPEAHVVCCGDRHEEVDTAGMNAEDEEQKFEALHANEAKDAASGEQEKGSADAEAEKPNERLQEEVQELPAENNVESEDTDESSSKQDIKFIDSKVDFSQMTYDRMCEEWEGNLRQRKDAASCLEERLADLRLSTAAHRDFETESEDATSQSDALSSEISVSAFESYVRGMTRAPSDPDIRPKPKSFIRPVMSKQGVKKTDPVAKYYQYKQLWEMFKLPGESDRRALRQEVKERLTYQPPPPKPRRVYVPNTYVVPTEKKRSALRWEIRNDLANGLLPYKFSYRF